MDLRESDRPLHRKTWNKPGAEASLAALLPDRVLIFLQPEADASLTSVPNRENRYSAKSFWKLGSWIYLKRRFCPAGCPD